MNFCGIDIGTTNTKAVVIDQDGWLLDRVTLPVTYSDLTWQLPAETWYDHFAHVLARLGSKGFIGRDKLFISITAQGGSYTLLDSHALPICPGVSWMKQSSSEATRSLASIIDPRQFYETTGWQINPWMMVCKLKEWLGSAGFRKADLGHVVTVPDYIHGRLAGRFITDITNAQITGLFDFQSKQWSPRILDWLELPSRHMSQVIERPEVILEDVAVPEGKISLVTSSHDQYAAMVAGGIDDGILMLATGSAWVINGKSRQPVFDFERLAVHPGRDLDSRFFGFIATFGPVGKGFELLLQKAGITYETLAAMDEEFRQAGLPREGIEISSLPNTAGSAGTARAVRRYMEAVAARVRFTLETMGIDIPTRLIMTGGAVTGGRWPAVVANVCRVPVEAIDFDALTAYGAALMARSTVLGESRPPEWPTEARVTIHEPDLKEDYSEWYQTLQRPILEKEKAL